MIPPLAPGQTDETQNMVGWKNTFNMRQVTLMNLAASQLSLRTNGRSHVALSRMRSGCISSPAKSLDLLRKNIQNAINRDIDVVIKKYLDKFFQPAIENIRNNIGRDSINEDIVKDVCRQILEDAKQMYCSSQSRDSSPYECSDSETGSFVDYRFGRPTSRSPAFRKRKESDTDSENSQSTQQKRNKYRLGNNHAGSSSSPSRLPIKREGPKWNPDRISSDTLFIMGAKANKVLGYGQTRGRLYVRHPDLLRYSGDQEDKDWLARNNLMPANGGKAYLMVLDDIKEVAQLDEYRNNSNLLLNELKGFEAPNFMINKIKAFMENVRTDAKSSIQTHSFDLFDLQTSQSMTPPSTALDSAPSTPSDTLQMLECPSVGTFSSKHSDTNMYIQAPEMSPGSNNSFLSGQMTQSPVSNNHALVSPHQLLNYSTADIVTLHQNNHPLHGNSVTVSNSTLSALLASQISSDNSQDDF